MATALLVTISSSAAADEIGSVAADFAEALQTVDGLPSKTWLEVEGGSGGFYIFRDDAAVDAYLSGPWWHSCSHTRSSRNSASYASASTKPSAEKPTDCRPSNGVRQGRPATPVAGLLFHPRARTSFGYRPNSLRNSTANRPGLKTPICRRPRPPWCGTDLRRTTRRRRVEAVPVERIPSASCSDPCGKRAGVHAYSRLLIRRCHARRSGRPRALRCRRSPGRRRVR